MVVMFQFPQVRRGRCHRRSTRLTSRMSESIAIRVTRKGPFEGDVGSLGEHIRHFPASGKPSNDFNGFSWRMENSMNLRALPTRAEHLAAAWPPLGRIEPAKTFLEHFSR
jgi:hypothetical protein